MTLCSISLHEKGSRVQKSWYAVKAVDQEDFMILTAVSNQATTANSSSNWSLWQFNNSLVHNCNIIIIGPSVWELPSTVAQASERTK